MVMAMKNFESILQNNLSLKLQEVSYRDVLFVGNIPCDLYSIEDFLYEVIVSKGSSISRERLKEIYLQGYHRLFIHEDDKEAFSEKYKKLLLKTTRTLSIDKSLQKSTTQVNFLTHGLQKLYENPVDNTLLTLQLQGVQNLSKYLIEEKGVLPKIYHSIRKNNHYYLYAQPMASSLLLLGFLKMLKVFPEKEISSLFVASYFKDIGMGLIPTELQEKEKLTSLEKQLFEEHGGMSEEILKGRLNIPQSYINIIKNHHFIDKKNNSLHGEIEMITGIETTLIAAFDMLVAMTSSRPYRPALSLFESLHQVKGHMEKQYSPEFKALVLYMKEIAKRQAE